MSFKGTVIALSPQWLAATRSGALMKAFGQILDDFYAQVQAGIKYRFPQYAPDDALRFVGNDRNFEQGPSESNSNYRTRLLDSIDANKRRGTARELLRQLSGYFSGIGQPALRLVSNSAVWHEWSWVTSLVTKTNVGTNWNWDGLTTRWWRGWVVIGSSGSATYRALASGGNSTSGTDPSATITTVVGDLLVVYCAASFNSNDTPTCTDDQGGTYDQIGTSVQFGSGTGRFTVFVRRQLATTAAATTVTVSVGAHTDCEMAVVAVSGMSKTGSNAVRSYGSQANVTSAPSVTLSQTTLSANLTMAVVVNNNFAGSATPPTGWTERLDAGPSNSVLEANTRDNGFAGSTISWGTSFGFSQAAFALELDARIWSGPPLVCGDPSGGTFDDGAVCGCSSTEAEVFAVQRLVQRWKPANVYVARIIVAFGSTSLYLRTNASPPNPNGEMADPSNFDDNAAYWLGGGEEP